MTIREVNSVGELDALPDGTIVAVGIGSADCPFPVAIQKDAGWYAVGEMMSVNQFMDGAFPALVLWEPTP